MTPEDLLWAAFEKADNCYVDRELDVIDTGGLFRMSQVVEHLRGLLTVRSVEELDALPLGTVVKDAEGAVQEKFDNNRWYQPSWTGGRASGQMLLPALVLYRPDWNTP